MLFTRAVVVTEDFDARGGDVVRELRAHKALYVLQGIVFLVAGALAAAFPIATALNVELIIGFVLLLTGAFQVVMALTSRMPRWALLSAGLSIGMGIVMLWQPWPFLLALATLGAVFLTLEGVLEIFVAFYFRPIWNWAWMLYSGILTLILAAILWFGFPVFGIVYLGLAVAVNLISYGMALLMLVWGSTSWRVI